MTSPGLPPTFKSVPLFRAVPAGNHSDACKSFELRDTVRLPVNVPYVVDNLWEFLRPDHMPCRRYAVYASATPALALANASTVDRGNGFTACALQINGPSRIAQLRVQDARWHGDIKRVLGLVQQSFADMQMTSSEERQHAAMLFMPAAKREDWQRLREISPFADSFIAQASALSTLWHDARATPEADDGELFFELAPGSSYTLNMLANS